VAAIRRGLCTPAEEIKCLEEVGVDNLQWTCDQCPKKKAASIHPYTVKLLGLLELQKGGYPFVANDLTLEEWVDLGRVKMALKTNSTCPLMANK
jgi:hypothetical protein